MNTPIAKQLRGFLRKDQILDSDLWREIYARDASYFDIKPKCIVRPENIEEVQKIVATAHANGLGVTFRTGGTSLSGQTVNSGIICELRGQWNRWEVRDNGKKMWFEPGLTARQVNARLKAYHTHIGPDPASSSAAMMGGILSNNSSGMEAGVKWNSYHTLSSMEFMLPNGARYDSSKPEDRQRFASQERELCAGLLQIRKEILEDKETLDKIVKKYHIKNVTGYAMNSFVDFEDPMDILIHLLIGSEGTLAFIVSAELNTVPLYQTYSSSLLYFPTVVEAAATAAWLGANGSLAVEMMDYAALRSVNGLPNDMPVGTTAMLIDYGASTPEELADKLAELTPKIKALKGLAHMDPFTKTVEERARLWRVRDGVFPCVAGVRVPGSAVILEDVAAPVAELDKLVEGVQNLFKAHNYNGSIFGHARDGDIHPLVTTQMKSEADVTNFRKFMEGLVNHVLSLDGSLKGEHGTGRAIAPFVSLEWGDKIYGLMKRVKALFDPHNVMNPGVMINSDPDGFVENIKSFDLFGDALGYPEADKCIECGYCEHVCPSRYFTLTPRQRLQARRVIARTKSKELEDEYKYIGNETCCSDNTCMIPCPQRIDTGIVTDAIREQTNSKIFNEALTESAKHYGKVETAIRDMLRVAVTTEKVTSPYPLIWGGDFLHKIWGQAPHWNKDFPMPAKLHYNVVDKPDFLYFPSCVTRIFGGSNFGKDDLITTLMRVGERAGFKMALPKEVHGLCCSQIWEHKGDRAGWEIAANKVVSELYNLSDEGTVPIVSDTTSCTHTLMSLAAKKGILTDENREKFLKLRILDITRWLEQHVMPKLKVSKPKESVLLHPTCASKLIMVEEVMENIAKQCARKVTVPRDSHCCGAAGDRGFIFPEVPKSALRDEMKDIEGQQFDGCYSLARTCEISMTEVMKRPFESIVYLVDETTEKAG